MKVRLQTSEKTLTAAFSPFPDACQSQTPEYQVLTERHTDSTCEVPRIFNGSFSFDRVVLAEHVLRPADKIPEVEEGWLGVWRSFPLRVGSNGTV